jgi:hypothetical protein
MPTYTAVAASEAEPNAPVTSTLIERLSSNPIAMFEGASGAPRLDEAARGGSVAGDTVLFQALGKDNPVSFGGDDGTSPWTIVPGSHFRATTSCGLRATCTVNSAFSGGEVRIVKNGTQVANATDAGAVTVDLSMTDGDTAWFEARGGSGAGGGATAGAIEIENVAYRTGPTRSCGGV